MSRWTLYSIAQLKRPDLNRTFFQQKWTAKADTRAYHGEQIREKKWARQFKRSIPAVVSMDHKYLARHDGSEQAAGRGAGAAGGQAADNRFSGWRNAFGLERVGNPFRSPIAGAWVG